MTATSENKISSISSGSINSISTNQEIPGGILPVITIRPETKLLDSITYKGRTIQSQYGMYLIGPEE